MPGRSYPEEDLYKYLFNIRCGLSKVCDKKFCLYCVRNCYNGPLKKADPKLWTCAFCTVPSPELLLLRLLQQPRHLHPPLRAVRPVRRRSC